MKLTHDDENYIANFRALHKGLAQVPTEGLLLYLATPEENLTYNGSITNKSKY